jgi:hypothetical protein
MKKVPVCRLVLLSIIFFVVFIKPQAQNVAINADSSMPNVNAMLDVKAFNKGLLIPRTSSASRLLIPATKGLLVYDTTTSSFWYNNGTNWVNMQGITSWALTGNGGTQDTANFIGTTDSTSLGFRVNNKTGGRIDLKHNNTYLGYKAAQADSAGFNNVVIGAVAAPNYKTAGNITAVGDSALYTNTTGTNNTAIGAKADVGAANLTNATAIGYGAKAAASNSIVLGNNSVTFVQTSGGLRSSTLLASMSGGAVDPSAVIEGRATNKGFLPPRLTATQIFAISTPATGLIVFNTTRNKAAYFDGITWRFFNDSEVTAPGTLPNATANCTYTNVCTIAACNTGFSDCDGMPGNGCEVNINSSASNCGACGVSAASLPNVASASCVNGGLVITACKPGYSDCDHIASNGCEVNILTDVHNCGVCGAQVGPFSNVAVAGCTGGVPNIISCNPGYSNCDGMVNNGCEVNINTDPNNCGACGVNGAGLPNVAVVSCTGGGLTIVSCKPGYSDCDGIASNGCEVNTTTDPYNCGQCGVNAAGLQNVATASCTGGIIAITSCKTGFADCDGVVSNGCEVNLNTDVLNCGLCGNDGTKLPNVALASCSGGVITIISCKTGYANCDGVVSNGCEVNLNTDVHNCSACGIACPAGKSCVAGHCQ